MNLPASGPCAEKNPTGLECAKKYAGTVPAFCVSRQGEVLNFPRSRARIVFMVVNLQAVRN